MTKKIEIPEGYEGAIMKIIACAKKFNFSGEHIEDIFRDGLSDQGNVDAEDFFRSVADN